MGQSSNDAAAKDSQTKSSENDCAEGMGNIAIHTMNASDYDNFEPLMLMCKPQLYK